MRLRDYFTLTEKLAGLRIAREKKEQRRIRDNLWPGRDLPSKIFFLK